MAGRAVIVATYQISAPDALLGEYRFASSTDLPQAGYAGLVAAEKLLVSELGEAIADSIRDTP